MGATHWESDRSRDRLAGPAPVPFFAPAWIKQRSDEWTPAGVQQRIALAWHDFLVPIQDPSRRWMTIVVGAGPAAVARTYDDLIAGRARADHGYVLSM